MVRGRCFFVESEFQIPPATAAEPVRLETWRKHRRSGVLIKELSSVYSTFQVPPAIAAEQNTFTNWK